MQRLIFSADSHIVEPPQMWQERVEPAYRDRAPRIERDLGGRKGEYYVFDTLRPIVVTRFFGAGHLRNHDDWAAFEPGGFERAPKSIFDPGARLKEQDDDGVDGELLFPTMGMVMLAAKDELLKAACFRAVNGYLAEYCRQDPDRLIGVGVVSLHDTAAAIKDLQDARAMGLRGVLITGSPGSGGFGARELDPFWAVAQDLDMPLTMHDLQTRGQVAFTMQEGRERFGFFMLPMEVQLTLAEMIFSGLFDRFPRLKVVSAENDIGWLPHFVHRMDHACTKIQSDARVLKRLPGQVVRENVWASTQFENANIVNYVARAIGIDRVMWGSDYPHPDSTFPGTRRFILDTYGELDTNDQASFLGGNVTRLYQVDLERLQSRRAPRAR